MGVMSAGVHNAIRLRTVGGPGFLLNGQGVNVRPQCDDSAVSATANDAQDPGFPYPPMPDARFIQFALNHAGRLILP